MAKEIVPAAIATRLRANEISRMTNEIRQGKHDYLLASADRSLQIAAEAQHRLYEHLGELTANHYSRHGNPKRGNLLHDKLTQYGFLLKLHSLVVAGKGVDRANAKKFLEIRRRVLRKAINAVPDEELSEKLEQARNPLRHGQFFSGNQIMAEIDQTMQLLHKYEMEPHLTAKWSKVLRKVHADAPTQPVIFRETATFASIAEKEFRKRSQIAGKPQAAWEKLRTAALSRIETEALAHSHHLEAAAEQVKKMYGDLDELVVNAVPKDDARGLVSYGLKAYATMLCFDQLFGLEHSLAQKLSSPQEVRKILAIRRVTLEKKLEAAKVAEMREPIEKELAKLRQLEASGVKQAGVFSFPFEFRKALHEIHTTFVKPHLPPAELAIVEHAKVNAAREFNDVGNTLAGVAKRALEGKRRATE